MKFIAILSNVCKMAQKIPLLFSVTLQGMENVDV